MVLLVKADLKAHLFTYAEVVGTTVVGAVPVGAGEGVMVSLVTGNGAPVVFSGGGRPVVPGKSEVGAVGNGVVDEVSLVYVYGAPVVLTEGIAPVEGEGVSTSVYVIVRVIRVSV